MKFKVGWAKARPSIISGRRNVSLAVPTRGRSIFDCVANSPCGAASNMAQSKSKPLLSKKADVGLLSLF